MGISTPVENTPSLALGTFEVKVIDMATAYSAIANGGYATWPHAIKEIYTRDGYQLYQREADTENRILDAGAVKDLTKMLEKSSVRELVAAPKFPALPPENRHYAGLPRCLVCRLYR